MNSDNTIEVPREQFLRHLLPRLIEGPVEWEVSDEVREKIGYKDLADTGKVQDISVDEDCVRIYSRLSSSVSEKVARATRWQPAEYKNHDVTVHVVFELEWPDGEYEFSDGTVLVEQGEYPTEPPAPDVHAAMYDEL